MASIPPASSDPATAAASGPVASDPVVGIDLGTTNSLVAIAHWPAGDPAGVAPRVLTDGAGSELVPSAVRFNPDGSTTIGVDARRHAADHPLTTVVSVKRLMGRSLSDAAADLTYLSYRVVAGPHNTVRVEIPGADSAPARLVSPQEVSALILRALKDRASAALGVPVTRAVITVPAYFDDAQRQATRDAARLAGLDALRIVNEPTAAALAYGLGLRAGAGTGQARTILVYDLGGGTFDASILRITPGGSVDATGSAAGADYFQVLSTSGDTHLGGDDFDHALVALFTGEIESRFGIPASSLDPAARRGVRDLAERAKIRLSEADTASVRVDLGADGAGAPRVYERTITRAEFETLIEPFVARTLERCRQAQRDARRELADDPITAVVLVGGATRTPLVRRRVAEAFGLEPYTALDPDTVVALGAAVQGAILAGSATSALLLDVIPLSLGIETVGGAAAKLIMRNSPVPARASEHFSTGVDNQTSIKLHVVQGEREMAADCRSLGTFHLSGIPPMPAGIPRVRVEFTVDASGVLSVQAVEDRSGKRASIQIVPNHGLTREEVDRIERESFTHAREDMTRHRVADLVSHATLDLSMISRQLERFRARLDPAYAAALEASIATVRDLVTRAGADWRSVNADEFQRAKEALDRASIRLQEIAIAASLQ
jgi:molecular chaperone DnaK (HSP70)